MKSNQIHGQYYQTHSFTHFPCFLSPASWAAGYRRGDITRGFRETDSATVSVHVCVSCEADGKWNGCRHARNGAAALQLLPAVTHRFYVYMYLVIKSLYKGWVCVDWGRSDKISQTDYKVFNLRPRRRQADVVSRFISSYRLTSTTTRPRSDFDRMWTFQWLCQTMKSPLRALTTQFIRFVFVNWPSAISHYFTCKYFTVYIWFFVRHLRAKDRAGWI